MSSSLSWVKLPVNFYKLPEIQQIEALPRGKNIVALYPRLLCLAGELNMRGCFVINNTPFTYKMLAKTLGIDSKTMLKALEIFATYGLVGWENGTIFLPHWETWQSADRLDRLREKDRIRKQQARENARVARDNEVMWHVHGVSTEHPHTEEDYRKDNRKENRIKNYIEEYRAEY